MTHTKALPHRYSVGDTAPPLLGTYVDSAGAPIDITGWTITLHLRRPGATVLIKTATITNGPAGQFQVSWAAGDFVVGDDQLAEVQFVDTGGDIFTAPKFLIDVDEEVA